MESEGYGIGSEGEGCRVRDMAWRVRGSMWE